MDTLSRHYRANTYAAPPPSPTDNARPTVSQPAGARVVDAKHRRGDTGASWPPIDLALTGPFPRPPVFRTSCNNFRETITFCPHTRRPWRCPYGFSFGIPSARVTVTAISAGWLLRVKLIVRFDGYSRVADEFRARNTRPGNGPRRTLPFVVEFPRVSSGLVWLCHRARPYVSSVAYRDRRRGY